MVRGRGTFLRACFQFRWECILRQPGGTVYRVLIIFTLAFALFACGDVSVGPEECKPQCIDRECGDDGCDGVCGTCTGEKSECNKGTCEAPEASSLWDEGTWDKSVWGP